MEKKTVHFRGQEWEANLFPANTIEHLYGKSEHEYLKHKDGGWRPWKRWGALSDDDVELAANTYYEEGQFNGWTTFNQGIFWEPGPGECYFVEVIDLPGFPEKMIYYLDGRYEEGALEMIEEFIDENGKEFFYYDSMEVMEAKDLFIIYENSMEYTEAHLLLLKSLKNLCVSDDHTKLVDKIEYRSSWWEEQLGNDALRKGWAKCWAPSKGKNRTATLIALENLKLSGFHVKNIPPTNKEYESWIITPEEYDLT